MNQVLDAMLARGVEVEERLLETIMADLVKDGRWEEGEEGHAYTHPHTHTT